MTSSAACHGPTKFARRLHAWVMPTFYSAPSYMAIRGLGWRANQPLSRAICTFTCAPKKERLAWDKYVCEGSAQGGHLEVLQWARQNACPADRGGHLSFLFFSFISLIADGPHHYHPACGHKGSSHLSPVHALQFFYRDASSALLQLVNQWLNFTYSRSHAFRYKRKNTNPTLVRIELTASVLADVKLTY